ncbi:MAG: GHKL domain-containing protein [Oscillospiraceae bacterium]|nr:GHKL domain-containing protein [Oscillospiraceae bacterium]
MTEHAYALIQALRFFIPALFSMLFRVIGLGQRSTRRTVVCLSAFTLYMLLTPYVLIPLMGYMAYTKIAPLIMIFGNFAVFFISSDPIVKTAFMHFTQANVIMLISISCNALRHILGLSEVAMLLVLPCVYFPVLLLALRYCAKPLRFIADHIKTGWGTLLMTPALTMVATLVVSVYSEIYFGDQPFFAAGVVLLVQLCFLFNVATLYRSLKEITVLSQQTERRNLLEIQANAMAHRLALMDEAMSQMSTARHDQRHFNHTIATLLRQGETAQATALLERGSQLLPPKPQTYCQNVSVNAAVSYYAEQAKRQGIRCEIRLIIPKLLRVDELSLAMAVSNLMENAITACAAVSEGARFLRFTAVDTGQLLLELANPYMGTVDLDEAGVPIARDKGHGRGSQSVAAFVKSCGGELVYTAADGLFRVQLMV